MRFKKTLAIFLLMLSLVSCGKTKEIIETDIQKQTEVTTVESDTVEATTVVDREGKEITIPSEVNTIVSLAPSITETLVNLGLGDKIIGVDTYSTGVDGLNADIASFDIMAPDVELLATLQPDIIFVSGISQSTEDDPLKPIKDLGTIVTYMPTSNTFQGIEEDILFLGTITNEKERAEEIVAKFQEDLASITEKLEGVVLEENTVYFEISPAPYLYSFGSGVFLNDALEMLHLENIFKEQEAWISITEEEILSRNPSIIFTNTYLEDAVTEVKGREGWDIINAVENDKVYKIDENKSSHANEFVVDAILEMAKAVYPDIFE